MLLKVFIQSNSQYKQITWEKKNIRTPNAKIYIALQEIQRKNSTATSLDEFVYISKLY